MDIRERFRTHDVENQPPPLAPSDLWQGDVALREAVAREGGGWASPELAAYGALAGGELQELARLANENRPRFLPFDARGQRIDQVEFHPAYHQLMHTAVEHGVPGFAWRHADRDGAHVARAALMFLHNQADQGSSCPLTMTYASVPALAHAPSLAKDWLPRIRAASYDPAHRPGWEKQGVTVGMGMTEKQGGSDVRANETIAVPVAESGRGQAYLLTGHKWFFSAPMCDAHLVVAKTEQDGLACFFVPRWLEDGTKNPIHVQRLKEKVGNRSNSSSEVEFKEAWGIMIGEAGRGIPTIIEMANYTRLTCSVGSTAMLRQALVQCIAYTRQRKAFGKHLAEQPLMRAVLADLALETEAAMQLSFHLAHCYETDDALSVAWKRIMTPASKFWICKRAVELTGEMMEVFGGNGYVDNGIMARIFKEAPVNTIWEGSGNVMCLDVLRAISRDVESIEILFQDLATTAMQDEQLKQELQNLFQLFQQTPEELQFMGRSLVSRLVILAQAVLLKRHAPDYVADGFIQSRYSPFHGRVVGMLEMKQPDVERLLHRAFAA